MKSYLDKAGLQDYTTKLHAKNLSIFATRSMVGTPLVASTAAEMTDTDKIYVYVGSETGYTSGNWYYYDGSAWASGGVYNSQGIVLDTALTSTTNPAQGKAVGDAVSSLSDEIDNMSDRLDNLEDVTSIWDTYSFTYENKVYSLTNNTFNDSANYASVLLPITQANEWKVTFRVNANGWGLVYFDENMTVKHSLPYPQVTETTSYTNLDIPYYSDSVYVWVQCFITAAYPVSNFKIYQNSAINAAVQDLTGRMETVETELDALSAPNFDAAGNYESNFLYADNVFTTQYSDATRVTGSYTPHTLDWIMLSVRVVGNGIGTGAYLDFENQTCGFFTPLSAYSGSTDIEKLTTTALPFTPVAEHPYIVVDDVIGLTQTVTFTDGYTLESVTITKTIEGGQYRCGYGNVTYQLGETAAESALTRNYRKTFMLQPKAPKLLIIGDSYVNGYFPYRYATLIKRDLKGNAFLWGMSGEASTRILNSFTTNLQNLIEPQYILWAVGTNDTDAETWISNAQSFVTACTSMGATPVFVTTTITSVSAHNTAAATINAWIKSSGYLYSDVSVVMTENYDGVTQNTDLFLDDGVHPTTAGFELMYKKIKADLPQICEN